MADHQPRLQSEASAMAGEGRQLGQQPDGGTAVNGSGDGLDRPSFTEYWREEKEHERAGRLQFVSEVPFHPSSSSSPSLAAGHSSQVPGEGNQPDPCEFFTPPSLCLHARGFNLFSHRQSVPRIGIHDSGFGLSFMPAPWRRVSIDECQ